MTQEEKTLFCQAACDIESGNYLIRQRTEKQLRAISETLEALATPSEKRTERQKAVVEEYRLNTNYEYAKSKKN